MREWEEFLKDRWRRSSGQRYIERAERDDGTSVEAQSMNEDPRRIVGGCRWAAIQVCVVDVEDLEGSECRRRRHLVLD